MEKTKNFINQNKESLEVYSGFSDYDVLFAAIENKTTTDHCIESCKAIIEGISKTILSKVNLNSLEILEYLDEQQQENLRTAIEQTQSNTIKFRAAYKNAANALSAYHQGFEKDFVLETGHSFCAYIGEVRNKKGDVSHGRQAPKKQKSSHALAHLVEEITDILAFHMLEIFSLIDFSRDSEFDKDWLIDESFRKKTEEQLAEIDQEEMFIRKFNDDLDKRVKLGGKLRYSLTLYQQTPEDYHFQLSEYQLEQESEEQ